MKNFILTTHCIFFLFILSAQKQTVPPELKLDSSFAFLQYYSGTIAQRFLNHFKSADKEKVVFVHFGGSHIQAERPTTVARKLLQEKYGDGGSGYVFSYEAANTYGSVNYKSTALGEWRFRKSFQGRLQDCPIGFCGMVVETREENASLSFEFKVSKMPKNRDIKVFFENDSACHLVEFKINDQVINGDHNLTFQPYGAIFTFNDTIKDFQIISRGGGERLRFYGLSIENIANRGVVYHSAGVGAAAYRSFLICDKYEDQANELKPDIAIIDYGTNDILYYNRVESSLAAQVEKTIEKLRAQNPKMIIILTSTQDLFYKRRVISACVDFRDLMDSLARKNNCMYWNFYDLAGGYNTIRAWADKGYARTDGVHLTQNGYALKGELLYLSIENTLNQIQADSSNLSLTIPPKKYDLLTPTITQKKYSNKIKSNSKYKYYKVRRGDTLSEIAVKFHTSVSKIKKANGIRGTLIREGQTLKIP